MAVAVPLILEAAGGAGAAAGGAAAAEGATVASASIAGESASAARLAKMAEMAGNIPLGQGDGGQQNSMQISQADIHRILHSGAAVAAVTATAQKCAGIANAMAITRDAEYDVVVQNRDDTTRCRATVIAKNFMAVVDDAHHTTLLKAAAQAGSDPIP